MMKVCISVLDILGFPTVLPIFGVAVDGYFNRFFFMTYNDWIQETMGDYSCSRNT